MGSYQHKNQATKAFRRLSNSLTIYGKRETMECLAAGGLRGFTNKQWRAYILKTALTKGK